MEKWHAQRDPRGDVVHHLGVDALVSKQDYGHGYESYKLVLGPDKSCYRLIFPDHFLTAIHVTTNEDVTVECHIITWTPVTRACLGTISLTKGENRLPFVGKVKPMISYYCYSSISLFFLGTDGQHYFPTKVTAIGLHILDFKMDKLADRTILRMTPSINLVMVDSIVSIEQAERSPWMKYGAFLWLLKKHYKDIITRLYRPGGLMAKRMERNIYGDGN